MVPVPPQSYFVAILLNRKIQGSFMDSLVIGDHLLKGLYPSLVPRPYMLVQSLLVGHQIEICRWLISGGFSEQRNSKCVGWHEKRGQTRVAVRKCQF